MRAKLTKNPTPTHKFRVTFDDGETVDFGARGYSDYTRHRSPKRMRAYLRRHGGRIPRDLESATDAHEIHVRALRVARSSSERWSKKDIRTAGFWSRWLLWSHPSVHSAKKFMARRFSITFA